MIQKFGILAGLVLIAHAAAGETVIVGEFHEDHNGYPCFATLHTDADRSVTLQLSDYRDIWSLRFVVADRASDYRRFFDSRGLRDKNAFKKAIDLVRIGERSFEFNDTSLLFGVRREEVNEKTTGIFSVDEQHNVTRALEAMENDGIEIRNLVSLDGTVEALGEFRSCSYTAMGLKRGERVETDFRAEYRMIFEDAFENWLTTMARAEHCLVSRFDDEAVSEVVEAATDAFYPGILNYRKRSEFREELEGLLPIAKLSGMSDAMTKGCLFVEKLADLSRMPVEKTIGEAAKLD